MNTTPETTNETPADKTPATPPVPVKPSGKQIATRIACIGLGTGACAVAGAVLIGLFTPAHTAGASRSYRLQQDQRQAEIAKSVVAAEPEEANGTSPIPKEP